MATALETALPQEWSLADMLASLGDIPPERIRMYPPPGMAIENDVLEAESRFGRICELIDGVLVEKTMGSRESLLAVYIARWLGDFVDARDLGIVLGADGTLRILRSQVRVPDVCFISWQRLPGRQVPAEPIFAVAPDLAIEVLSPGNTAAEMQRKLRDYFAAGVRLVWYIDPATRSARTYTSLHEAHDVYEDGALSGGNVLPDFSLPLAELFAKLDRKQKSER